MIVRFFWRTQNNTVGCVIVSPVVEDRVDLPGVLKVVLHQLQGGLGLLQLGSGGLISCFLI